MIPDKNFLSSPGGHGLDLYCLNNGVIVQTMLPFHKCSRIYEIKGSVMRASFQAVKAQIRVE